MESHRSQQAPEEFSSLVKEDSEEKESYTNRLLQNFENHRSKNAEIDRLWNVVERESLEIEHVKETKQLQLDQLKIARVMTKGTEDGGGNIMKNVNTELVESATYLKRRRDVDYKEDRDGKIKAFNAMAIGEFLVCKLFLRISISNKIFHFDYKHITDRLPDSLIKRAYQGLLNHFINPVLLEIISGKSDRIKSYLRHKLEVYENLLNRKCESIAQEKLLCP
ncbi:hypothetical protein GLOIN_2v1773502 [Rhizophagus irregularis DAOM 181602=DAOM 197198]|nr:hypothetical protein GLOIN_2v1773502 [Rhizophagus irregularis DAOM 181602=DAOM 197198]